MASCRAEQVRLATHKNNNYRISAACCTELIQGGIGEESMQLPYSGEISSVTKNSLPAKQRCSILIEYRNLVNVRARKFRVINFRCVQFSFY